MVDALIDIASFVTAAVCFIYGTRIAWVCGRKCQFSESLEIKVSMLVRSIPAATVIFFFGFVIVYKAFSLGAVTWLVASITSAIVLAAVLVSMAMPDLKRPASAPQGTVWIEKEDGSRSCVSKAELNKCLEKGKVKRFKRSSGWVDVADIELRGSRKNTIYAGVERRETLGVDNDLSE